VSYFKNKYTNQNTKPTIVMGMALFVSLFGLYIFQKYIYISKDHKLIKTIVMKTQSCDLHNNQCLIKMTPTKHLILEVTPRPINMVQPIEIHIKKVSFKIKKAWVDFSSTEMNMGFNRPPFQKNGPQDFIAKTLLPSCTEPRMTWTLTLLIYEEENIYKIPFLFTSSPLL